jgi:DNA-directed RNA polymerase alpha subunit
VFLYPTPELPDDTRIDDVRFSTRIRNALSSAGLKTVGEAREASDATLLGLQDLGQGSVAHLVRRSACRHAMALGRANSVRRGGVASQGRFEHFRVMPSYLTFIQGTHA